jgi:uncharacterized protein
VPVPFPIFPLRGAILLPRASMPLNIFEPRYVAMVGDALSTGRVIGIIQPADSRGDGESPVGKVLDVRTIGCVGRLTAYQELDDNRLMITLTGIARFDMMGEVDSAKPYRIANVDFEPWREDFEPSAGEDEVDRDTLIEVLKVYLEKRQIRTNFKAINNATTEFLVNTLSVISPYGPEEKQALLEARSLKKRAEILVALAKMDIASGGESNSGGNTLQ